jgi:hypothetical protein
MTALAAAQTPTQTDQTPKFFAAGLSLMPHGTPQIQGWGGVAIPINNRVASWTDYDVVALPGTPVAGQKFTFPKIQYTMRTGVAVRAYDVTPKISIWGIAGAGVAADPGVGVSFGSGGFVDFVISPKWGALVILMFDRNAVIGNQFSPRFGFRYKLQ